MTMRTALSLSCLLLLVCGLPAQAQPARGARGVLEGERPGRTAADLRTLSALNGLIAGHTDRWEEARILALLAAANDAQLDWLLRAVDLRELVASLDDHAWGPKNYTALLELLSKKRLAALSVEIRAELVDALQRGPTDAAEERAIRNVFVATKGKALTRLKDLVDAGGDHRDLHQLLKHDIDDPALQKEITAHFTTAAAPTHQIRLLSDVDDTVYSSLKDKRYPKETRYPGLLAFHQELGGGAHHATFITARPDIRAGIIEDRTLAHLRELGIKQASMLTGSLLALRSHDAMARKKLENFDEYRRLYPEYGFVFVGDNGQGDATFAAKVLKDLPGALKAAFIHNVTGAGEDQRASYAKQGVDRFETYVGAALLAHRRKLLSREAVVRVAKAAGADFRTIRFDSSAQRAQAWAQLQRDIATANALR